MSAEDRVFAEKLIRQRNAVQTEARHVRHINNDIKAENEKQEEITSAVIDFSRQLQDSLSNARQQITQLLLENSELNGELGSTKGEVSVIATRLESIAKELEACRVASEEKSKIIESQRKDISALEGMLKSSNEQYATAQRRADNLDVIIREGKAHNQKLIDQIAQLKNELASVYAKLNALPIVACGDSGKPRL